MAVIVGMFYSVVVRHMEDEAALWRAADSLLNFLESTGRKNVLIEIENEIDVMADRTPYDLVVSDRQAEMIVTLRAKASRTGAPADRMKAAPSQKT